MLTGNGLKIENGQSDINHVNSGVEMERFSDFLPLCVHTETQARDANKLLNFSLLKQPQHYF